MAGTTTRMLLLGAVAMFAPVNGYQIRRELTSWHVDEWANLNPGSIYHALNRLSADDYLLRHQLQDGGREISVYELTDAGRAELEELVTRALREPDPYDRTAFSAAFGMLPHVGRNVALACLRERRSALQDLVQAMTAQLEDTSLAPPHARRGQLMLLDTVIAELAWLRETLDDIAADRLRFGLHEDWGWHPTADDPGRQMSLDQEKYRAMLGR